MNRFPRFTAATETRYAATVRDLLGADPLSLPDGACAAGQVVAYLRTDTAEQWAGRDASGVAVVETSRFEVSL